MKEEDLPEGVSNLTIEGAPGFVIASLRGFLRE